MQPVDAVPEDTQDGKITVVIADDHAILREGLFGLLEEQSDIDVVGQATTGLEAVAKVKELSPDILLLDLVMPVMNGIDALNELTGMDTSTRTIVLTGVDDDEALAKAVRAGAAGYLLKDSASSQLMDAIRCVAAGNCWLPPGLTSKLFHGFSKRPKEEEEAAKFSLLTARETEVLKLMGEARSNSQIADALFISEHTVKVHVSRILEKLQLDSRVEAVKLAIRAGIIKA